MPPSVCSIYTGGSSRDAGAGMLFVSVLFFFRIMQIQLEVQRALDDTGTEAGSLRDCMNCVIDGAALPGMAGGFAFERDGGTARKAETYITGGKFGISLIGSDFSGEEITLRAAYHIRLHPDLLVVGFCDGTAGRLQEMDRMECCRGK